MPRKAKPAPAPLVPTSDRAALAALARLLGCSPAVAAKRATRFMLAYLRSMQRDEVRHAA